MLTIADFSRKIIFDLNKTFPIARVQGKYVIVESNPNRGEARCQLDS